MKGRKDLPDHGKSLSVPQNAIHPIHIHWC